MTDQTCPRCGRPTRGDAFVCGECVRIAGSHLRDVAEFLSWADDKRARRGSTWRFGTIGRTAERPLPYDPRVTEAVDEVVNGLIGWARICEDSGAGAWPADQVALAGWIADRLGLVASQPWAQEAVDAFAGCHARLVALFDIPPEREAIGQCNAGADADGDGGCPEILSAEAGATFHDCPRCETRWDVRDRRAALLDAAGDFRVTIAEAVRLLRVDGRDVTPRLLWAVVRTVGIVPVDQRMELDSKGRRRRVDVYRLGALQGGVEAMEADPEQRRAVKRAMRGQREPGRVMLDA